MSKRNVEIRPHLNHHRQYDGYNEMKNPNHKWSTPSTSIYSGELFEEDEVLFVQSEFYMDKFGEPPNYRKVGLKSKDKLYINYILMLQEYVRCEDFRKDVTLKEFLNYTKAQNAYYIGRGIYIEIEVVRDFHRKFSEKVKKYLYGAPFQEAKSWTSYRSKKGTHRVLMTLIQAFNINEVDIMRSVCSARFRKEDEKPGIYIKFIYPSYHKFPTAIMES